MSFDITSVGGIFVTISIVLLFFPYFFKLIMRTWKIKYDRVKISDKMKIICIFIGVLLLIFGIIKAFMFNSLNEKRINHENKKYLSEEKRPDLNNIESLDSLIPNNEIVDKQLLNSNVGNDSFRITNYVRLKGMDEWVKEIDAKLGDIVEFQIGYENTSQKTIKDVMLLDLLPNGLMYIKDSTILKNANHPQGVSITSDNINSIVDKGINIGSYSDESNAFIKFEAIVIDKGYKGLDSVKMTNWAKITSGNNTKISFSKISVFID